VSEEGSSDRGPDTRLLAPSAALIRLAEACGISATYTGWDGREHRCSSGAIRGALAAMGISPQDDAACQKEYDRLAAEEALRTLPPVVVVRERQPIEVPVHAPKGLSPVATLRLESGEVLTPEAAQPSPSAPESGRRVLETSVLRLAPLPTGYHTLEVTLSGSPPTSCPLIVTPERLQAPGFDRRPWGVMAHLPSIRSAESWGIGDLADLRDLAILGSFAGADFVAVTPLCAAEPVPPLTPSPYLPTTRLFANPLYIRVEDIPETAYLNSTDRSLISWLAEAPRASCRTQRLLDRDSAWTAKKSALE